MKNQTISFKPLLMLGLVSMLCIFITKPSFSQEPPKKETGKKIMVKVTTDDDGKTTVIDTIMYVSDTTVNDSAKKEIRKVIMMEQGGKPGQFRFQCMPHGGYNYDFEMPCPPECLAELEGLEDFEWEGDIPEFEMQQGYFNRRIPGPGPRVIEVGGNRQSLNDILGDIPMDRVVNYSVKDTKNGKRITIDLNNAPVFEQKERIIIIREPGRMKRNRNNQERQVKVIVSPDKAINAGDASEVPPPPPPPPPAEKSKKAPK